MLRWTGWRVQILALCWLLAPSAKNGIDPIVQPCDRLTRPPHAIIPFGSSVCRAPPGQDARRSVPVVTAYILVQTEVGKAAQVARDIAQIKGVQQAEDVTGPYDVIVRAEARNIDELGKLVVARVQAVDGITRTLTCPVVHL
jgi:DNA-binding Lrp family transcriptional regulator